MCLIITALMTLITLWVWKKLDPDNRFYSRTIFICFAAAAIMWTVDRFFALSDGEAFFELSLDDTLLGLTVSFCVMVLWAVMAVFGRTRFVKAGR